MTQYRKKLIEVALPLEAINKASAREKSIRHGHPSTLHLWWARRPLAAARAVIFAQMVDDPGNDEERQKLFELIEELVQWENTTNEEVLERAREEIRKSWRNTCAENRDHPRAAELFNPDKLPAFHDPFAGGGSLPLEAQRLGLESYASDLNPVAVLINKAMIEIPPKFAGRPPVNPEAQRQKAEMGKQWRGAQGLAEDVRYYGKWMRDEAERRIGHLYPKIEVTEEMANDREDLKSYIGQSLTVIAWLWARTVKSPNPAFRHVDVPLASTFMLSTKKGKEVYIEPVIDRDSYSFTVKVGNPESSEAKNGTSAGKRKAFYCLITKVPINYDYIRIEAKEGRMGTKLMAIVAEGRKGRIYISPTEEQEIIAQCANPMWYPDTEMPKKHRNFQPPIYGMNSLGDLFTPRQLLALTTFSDLILNSREQIMRDIIGSGMAGDTHSLDEGGFGSLAYADAVAVYLALAIDKASDYDSALVVWSPTRNQAKTTFARHALPMVWDFAEINVFAQAAGDIAVSLEGITRVLSQIGFGIDGHAVQADAQSQSISSQKIISTDPPYYDNISYGDLSDFFYVWLRRSLMSVFPNLLATLSVPKAEELVASQHRYGSKEQAEAFFLKGMTQVMHNLTEQMHTASPLTLYYAFKQSETELEGTSSTGWETFLDAIMRAGLSINGTWPIRTERDSRSIGIGTNALASSIVLVCRPRPANALMATRRDFLAQLKSELPSALATLQSSNIAPVDLAQAAIGPGMAVFTRYTKVLDVEGNAMPVREALSLINQTLDETLAEQEGDFDAETRWALAWFDQNGFNEGEYGIAETLSKAKNTSVSGMVATGILISKSGKVRLLKPAELPADWDPENDPRQNVWEITHHLIRALESGGEPAAAELVHKLGGQAEVARELAYRLYTVCERKKRAAEALSYNSLVQSWPEISRLSREVNKTSPEQLELSIQ